jgi:hypothetical protein
MAGLLFARPVATTVPLPVLLNGAEAAQVPPGNSGAAAN